MTTVKEKYGFLPLSVWHVSKDKTLELYIKDNGESRTNKRSDGSFLPNYKLSEFNPEIAKRVIKYWSNENDLIFDPFAGRTTRGFVATVLNRYYVGCEISQTAFDETISQREKWNETRLVKNKRDDFSLLNQDGCEFHEEIENNSVDLVFTCPPYWNLEKYESCKGQLSDCKTYQEFISKISNCIQECNRVLKDKKFSIWVVSDFRRNGYYCLHKDIIEIHKLNGFELWDIVINVLNSPFVAFKAQFNDDQKYTGKTHEYILVFRKC